MEFLASKIFLRVRAFLPTNFAHCSNYGVTAFLWQSHDYLYSCIFFGKQLVCHCCK